MLTGNGFNGTGSLWSKRTTHLLSSGSSTPADTSSPFYSLKESCSLIQSHCCVFFTNKKFKTSKVKAEYTYLYSLKTWNPFISWITLFTLRGKQDVKNSPNCLNDGKAVCPVCEEQTHNFSQFAGFSNVSRLSANSLWTKRKLQI